MWELGIVQTDIPLLPFIPLSCLKKWRIGEPEVELCDPLTSTWTCTIKLKLKLKLTQTQTQTLLKVKELCCRKPYQTIIAPLFQQ